VNARRLLTRAGGSAALVALLFLPNLSNADTKKPAKPAAKPPPALTVPSNTQDAASSAAQAARLAADSADQAADGSIAPPKDDSAAESPMDRARQGIVVLERGGKAIGVGSVLAGDGRILTALSQLGHGNNVDARFADGTVTNVKVGHTDRAWDLALLVPQNGKWKKGIRAARVSANQAGSKVSTFSMVGQKDVAPARTIIKGEKTLIGGDNELLKDALEVASRFKSTDIGSPVVDDKGDVVAMIAKACAPIQDQPCTQVPYGVPVSAIKAFLKTAPANAVPPAPWLGIQGVSEDAGPVKGVRVQSVHPRSPAAAAGLKGGNDRAHADTVVAVDGAPVTTPEALGETINQRAVGDSVQLLIFGAGKYRQATLTLRPAPAETKAKLQKAAGPEKPLIGPRRPPTPSPRGRAF
jgi:serine protease Do